MCLHCEILTAPTLPIKKIKLTRSTEQYENDIDESFAKVREMSDIEIGIVIFDDMLDDNWKSPDPFQNERNIKA